MFEFAAVFTLVVAASHEWYRLELTEHQPASSPLQQLNKEHLWRS